MADSESLRRFLETLFGHGSAEGSAISFERFMQEALYHPQFGYYTANIESVGGSRGDFATSPTLSNWMGRAIANWIREESAAHDTSLGELPLIEIGAGEGSLMRSVLDAFSWRERRKLRRVGIVETSPVLRDRQRETLKKHRRRISWFESPAEALESTGGRALIFSNELVDAFPVIRLQDRDEILLEFSSDAGLREVFRPLTETRPELKRAEFSALAIDWPAGQRLELHESYRTWLQNWLPELKQGSLLTIDYGGGAEQIYGRRKEGSLRAFFRHQRLIGAGIYRMFGKQDLTADVCFDDLCRWGESSGLETVREQSQADFLNELAPVRGADRSRETEFLRSPDGAGEAFRVLGQRKTVD